MGKHNYPKTRKPRDTSYARSTQLINKHGKEKLSRMIATYGMYTAAKFLNTSPFVIRYIRRYKLNGTEEAESKTEKTEQSRTNNEEV